MARRLLARVGGHARKVDDEIATGIRRNRDNAGVAPHPKRSESAIFAVRLNFAYAGNRNEVLQDFNANRVPVKFWAQRKSRDELSRVGKRKLPELTNKPHVFFNQLDYRYHWLVRGWVSVPAAV